MTEGDIQLNGNEVIADGTSMLWMDSNLEVSTECYGGCAASCMRICSGEYLVRMKKNWIHVTNNAAHTLLHHQKHEIEKLANHRIFDEAEAMNVMDVWDGVSHALFRGNLAVTKHSELTDHNLLFHSYLCSELSDQETNRIYTKQTGQCLDIYPILQNKKHVVRYYYKRIRSKIFSNIDFAYFEDLILHSPLRYYDADTQFINQIRIANGSYLLLLSDCLISINCNNASDVVDQPAIISSQASLDYAPVEECVELTLNLREHRGDALGANVKLAALCRC